MASTPDLFTYSLLLAALDLSVSKCNRGNVVAPPLAAKAAVVRAAYLRARWTERMVSMTWPSHSIIKKGGRRDTLRILDQGVERAIYASPSFRWRPTKDDVYNWNIVVHRIEGAVSATAETLDHAKASPWGCFAAEDQGDTPRGFGVPDRLAIIRIDSDGKSFANKRIALKIDRTVEVAKRLKAQTYRMITARLEHQGCTVPIPTRKQASLLAAIRDGLVR